MYTATLKSYTRKAHDGGPAFLVLEGFIKGVPVKGDKFTFTFATWDQELKKDRSFQLTFDIYTVEMVAGGFRFTAKDAFGEVAIGGTLGPDEFSGFAPARGR